MGCEMGLGFGGWGVVGYAKRCQVGTVNENAIATNMLYTVLFWCNLSNICGFPLNPLPPLAFRLPLLPLLSLFPN